MLSEIKEDSIKYQWIKGDKIGAVEILDKEDTDWVYFVGGNRIAKSLLSEYMMLINHNNQLLDFSIQQTQQNQQIKTSNKIEDDPVISIFNKMSKLEIRNISINFEIKAPKRNIYGLLLDTFDENHIKDVLLSYLVSQIDEAKIKEILNNEVKKLVDSFTLETS